MIPQEEEEEEEEEEDEEGTSEMLHSMREVSGFRELFAIAL